jgi:hypothetical protein
MSRDREGAVLFGILQVPLPLVLNLEIYSFQVR